MKDVKIMEGSTQAPSDLHITVTERGPYLVYGAPRLCQEFIVTDSSGECKRYEEGVEFSTADQPTALCRCGHSQSQPYCDLSHLAADWNPELTAPNEAILRDANIIEGETLTLYDNERYCVYARFCHPQGGTWRLTEESGDEQAREEAIRQATHCPAGRLTEWGEGEDEPYELKFTPSMSLLEDPSIGVSSGIWVKGGILIQKEDGESFEVRNRVVMCRCGASHNKPFCDGHHAQRRWSDNLDEKESLAAEQLDY